MDFLLYILRIAASGYTLLGIRGISQPASWLIGGFRNQESGVFQVVATATGHKLGLMSHLSDGWGIKILSS